MQPTPMPCLVRFWMWPVWTPEFIHELCTWMSLCTKYYGIGLAMQRTRYSAMLQKTRNECVHVLTLFDEHEKNVRVRCSR